MSHYTHEMGPSICSRIQEASQKVYEDVASIIEIFQVDP